MPMPNSLGRLDSRRRLRTECMWRCCRWSTLASSSGNIRRVLSRSVAAAARATERRRVAAMRRVEVRATERQRVAATALAVEMLPVAYWVRERRQSSQAQIHRRSRQWQCTMPMPNSLGRLDSRRRLRTECMWRCCRWSTLANSSGNIRRGSSRSVAAAAMAMAMATRRAEARATERRWVAGTALAAEMLPAAEAWAKEEEMASAVKARAKAAEWARRPHQNSRAQWHRHSRRW